MGQICGRGEEGGSHGISLLTLSKAGEQAARLLRALPQGEIQVLAAGLSEILEMHRHAGTALPSGAPTIERDAHTCVNKYNQGLQAQGYKGSGCEGMNPESAVIPGKESNRFMGGVPTGDM